MSTSSRDVEKGEQGEENEALLGARNLGRQDDGERLNRADYMELADFEKPGPSSSIIALKDDEKLQNILKSFTEDNQNSNTIKTEESNQFQEPNLSEGSIESENTNESEDSTDELQKPEPHQNISLIAAIYNHKNKELISWLENLIVPYACPTPILTAACQAQSNEEALRILLDAGRETGRFGCVGITPLHAAAFTDEPKTIAKILGFPEGLTNEKTSGYRTHFIPVIEDVGSFKVQNIPLGYTALHVASAYAHSQAVRALLVAGANPNLRDKSNSTPLDIAGVQCPYDDVQSYVDTLQLLLEYGGTLSRVESLVLERALHMHSLQALTLLLDAGAPINHRNPSGYTPMHLCVKLRLKEHLKVLAHHSSPEMDYRAVDVTDDKGSTALHWAVRERWSDGVTVALLARAIITIENSVGDTALHLAAKAGDFDIIKQILGHDKNKQCDYIKKNFKGESPLSYAILSGNADIVKLMCYLNHDMLIYLDTIKVGNLNPLEYAAENNFQKLFIFILGTVSTYEYATPRILKILAKHNLPKLFAELEKDLSLRYVMKTIIAKKCILHEATKHNSREMIIILLREGADLSQRNKDGQTAISLLMYHVTKPTEFVTEILDRCINSNKNICDKDCVIKINYSVLKPENKDVDNNIKFDDDSNDDDSNDNEDDEDDNDHLKTKANDMKVLEALIETGDVYDQRSLLTHPVVESFLYLKWKKCKRFIYYLIIAYVVFLICLNTFIGTIYYHMDHKIKEQDIHFIFNLFFWRIATIITFLLFCLVVLLFWLLSTTRLRCNKTIWLKLLTSKTKWRRNKMIWLKLLLIVGGAIMICTSTPMDAADSDIIRGVAVITVSLSWIYLMILLSWTPTLGFYMQMYGKVSRNVIKVMLSFSFPIVGFSICFMILLRSKEPFDDPIAAFLKTMVMMTSEFEYENLVKNKTNDCPKDTTNSTLDFLEDAPITSVFMLRIFFLLFLICVAIVLMNLMLGFAVSDFQELAHDGRQRRLMKQIECITALEKLFLRWPFSSLKFTETETWKVPSEVSVTPDSKIFGKEIKEIILNKAQSLRETKEKETDDVGLKVKIDDMYDLTKEKMADDVVLHAKFDDMYDLTKEKMADDVGMKSKIDDMYELTKKISDLEKGLSQINKSVNTISETVEKRIAEAMNNILEAIANEKRADLNLGQTRQTKL